MADAVTSQNHSGRRANRRLEVHHASDGTGESAVKKVDVSALNSNARGVACSGVQINRIWWQCTGMSVKIEFDASTNVLAIGLSEDSNGYHDYSDFSGIPNNAGSGKTGDLDFTTVGHSSGDTYMIILELIKSYG